MTWPAASRGLARSSVATNVHWPEEVPDAPQAVSHMAAAAQTIVARIDMPVRYGLDIVL